VSVCHDNGLPANFEGYGIAEDCRKSGWFASEVPAERCLDRGIDFNCRSRGRLCEVSNLELGFHGELGFAQFESGAPDVAALIEGEQQEILGSDGSEEEAH
jgi:hypothetical protein